MATEAAAFFTEYGESNRYTILEVIGKGSYGVVASALDNTTGARNRCDRLRSRAGAHAAATGERVAIKKINDVFEHVSVSAFTRAAPRMSWAGPRSRLPSPPAARAPAVSAAPKRRSP